MTFRPIRNYSNPGEYPDTEHTLRNLYRNRAENGLGSAFTKVQGRVLADIDRLQALLAERAEVEAALQDRGARAPEGR